MRQLATGSSSRKAGARMTSILPEAKISKSLSVALQCIRLLSEGFCHYAGHLYVDLSPLHCRFQYGNGYDTRGLSLTSNYLGPATFPLANDGLKNILIATLNSGGSNLTAIRFSLERKILIISKFSPLI